MKNKMFSIGAVILFCPLTTIWAVNLCGNWIARIPNNHWIAETALSYEAAGEKSTFPGDPLFIEAVFSFKVNGNQLTGKVTTPKGDTAISEGKIDGDEFSFSVKRSIEGKQIIERYKGKIAGRVYGDEIELICEIEGGTREPLEFIAKREFPIGDYYLPIKELYIPTDPTK